MAVIEKLSDSVLPWIASQIGKQIFHVVALESFVNQSMKLAETFPVWNLEADEIGEALKNHKDLKQIATPAGLWHHQIKIGETEKAFVRSQHSGESPESWSINEIFLSPLAEKIDTAITWVDENVITDEIVRLLFIPAYHLYAFWLFKKDANESQVLIIEAPSQYQSFELDKLYSSTKFLEELFDAPPIIGARSESLI